MEEKGVNDAYVSDRETEDLQNVATSSNDIKVKYKAIDTIIGPVWSEVVIFYSLL